MTFAPVGPTRRCVEFLCEGVVEPAVLYADRVDERASSADVDRREYGEATVSTAARTAPPYNPTAQERDG
jgi:hypothetical protein